MNQINHNTHQNVIWKVEDAPIPYLEAVAFMESHVEKMAQGEAPEMIWLLEHPPLYTAGTSAKIQDLVDARFPVYASGRGGQYTYHGPGQRVVYVMLDLNRRGKDIRKFVQSLEAWVIATLSSFNIKGHIREGRVGVWVERPERGEHQEDKIAAIGIRVRKWITFHGLSINVSPDLSHYSGIIPCGLNEFGVTSLLDLGQIATIEDCDIALKNSCEFLR